MKELKENSSRNSSRKGKETPYKMQLNQKLNKQTLQRLLNSSKKHKKSQSAVNSAEKENYTAT